MEPRDNLLIIVTGKKRVGKSYESLRQLLYYAYISKTPRKSLIYDVNNEYGNYTIENKVHKIQTIKEKDLIKYSNHKGGEVRRIVPILDNGLPMEPEEAEALLIKTITYSRNVIIMIDDLNTIFGDSMPVKFSSLLCNNAHRGADVILQIQSVGRLLPKLLQNCEIIRFHSQLDDVDDSKGKLMGDYKILKIAQLMVNKVARTTNPRFFVNVYRNEGRIKGAFSPRMLATAIQDYLLENPSELTPMLQRRDGKGKKVYTYETALQIKVKEMYDVFNGNAAATPAKK